MLRWCARGGCAGHALYEQGRNLGPEWEGLPVNSALSMGIHESQSLFWERMVRAPAAPAPAAGAAAARPQHTGDRQAQRHTLTLPAHVLLQTSCCGRVRHPNFSPGQWCVGMQRLDRPAVGVVCCCAQVGLSQPFAEWLLPRIKSHFPDFPERSAAELYQAENVMKTPSLIRVEADEVRLRAPPAGGHHTTASRR